MTNLEEWIGRQQERTQVLDAHHTKLLAVTLDAAVPEKGTPLPPCWHWAWFNDALPASKLGRDGHPKHGSFLPPISLPRRMWAGGSLEFVAPLIIGQETKKVSTIESITHRKGSTGDLTIITVGHELFQSGHLCVNERQNLVFREDPKRDAPSPKPLAPPNGSEMTLEFTPTPTLMFRYSALTFNGHRIHYDVDYAREVEGYPDLVFHAPLTATRLCDVAIKLAGDKPLSSFEYRATAPLFCNAPVKLCGKREQDKMTLWAVTPEDGQAMLATAKA